MPPYADLFLSILRRVNPGYPAGLLPLILEIIAYLGDFAIYTYGIVCASSVAICSNVLIGYGTCRADARSIRLIILALVLCIAFSMHSRPEFPRFDTARILWRTGTERCLRVQHTYILRLDGKSIRTRTTLTPLTFE
jgi:hypothetical protein